VPVQACWWLWCKVTLRGKGLAYFYHGIVAFQFNRALDVMQAMCVDHDKLLVIVTLRYLVDETSEMLLMV